MKKEAKILKGKAINSLRLSVDHFNRQWDVGRSEAVLIFLDHSFEMLMKSAILERTGRLRESGQEYTYTFEKCIRIGLSNGEAKFLTDDQALTLQSINGLRDAVQHHHLDISENHLYLHTQSGITLFNELLDSIFQEQLGDHMLERVLPVSTVAPLDPIVLFNHELDEIRKLLAPRTRRTVEARARLRSLAILDGSISGDISQPGERRLNALAKAIRNNSDFDDVFPGIAAVQFVAEGSGPQLQLRMTKREGLPVHNVPEGQPGGSVIAVRRVNDLDFYSLGHNQLAQKVNLTPPKLTAALRYLDIESDPDCFILHKVNKSTFKRYSPEAIKRVRSVLNDPGIDAIWQVHAPTRS